MKKRVCLVAALLLAPMVISLTADASVANVKPNILFILTDDQKWNVLGCLGNPNIQTPNIDRLAKQGVVFSNHFVTTSICCSSRASILTGQYMRRHGIEDFKTSFKPEQWAETYPALLRQNGYRTGFIGKFGVGAGKSVQAMAAQFDYWRGVTGQGGMYFINPKDPNRTHETARFGQDAVNFLATTPANQPFCLSISFTAPHARDEMPHLEQFQPDDRDTLLYTDKPLPESETATDAFFQKLPIGVQKSIAHKRWTWRFDTAEHYQKSAKNYYRLVTGIDREVGRILEELEKHGLASNTIIVFTSDNGFFLGDRKLSDKFFMYEESLRVPLIIYDPLQPAVNRGRNETAMTLNIDFAPTLLTYAGITPPPRMQGCSLTPLVENQRPTDWRTDFFYEHHFFPEHIPPSEGIRTERWTYIRWLNEKPLVEELFDLKNDPLEAQNLANDPSHQAILDQLRTNWANYRAKLE
jgi:arylsulfatase A-like enzyme